MTLPTDLGPPTPGSAALRRFGGSALDYEVLSRIQSAAFAARPRSAAELLTLDWMNPPEHRLERHFIEVRGKRVGFGCIGEPHWSPRPGKYFLRVCVEPTVQKRGLGSQYFQHALTRLRGLGANTIVCETRDDLPDAMSFLEHRGFVPVLRAPISTLKRHQFRGETLQSRAERASGGRIAVHDLATLQATVPDCFERLYRLVIETGRDVPADEPEIDPHRNRLRMVMSTPWFDPHAVFVARDPVGRFVGISGLMCPPAMGNVALTWFTGVQRSYRRMGVAYALKFAAISYAFSAGYTAIETENEKDNPMLSLNRELGFVSGPAWVEYKKTAIWEQKTRG